MKRLTDPDKFNNKTAVCAIKAKSHLRLKTIAALLAVLIFAACLTGCGKENKYVNAGVYLSTDGLSLCLTGYGASLQGVSNYVFFSEGIDQTLGKLNRDTQNIDIAYVLAGDLSKLTRDMDVKVVFVDCLNTDGSLRGVWIARNEWLKSAPNYSQKYINNMVKCADYRTSNMKMTYSEAYASVKDIRDFDFTVQSDAMQFVAAFEANNSDKVADNNFISISAKELETMFKNFADGKGEGYEICRAAYDKYCTGANAKSFEELFDLSLMNKAVETYFRAEK